MSSSVSGAQAAALASARMAQRNTAKSLASQTADSHAESSSGDGITSLNDAASDVLNGNNNANGSSNNNGSSTGSDTGSNTGSSDGGSGTSPLLEGEMTFEELVGEICNGIDLIFAVKRSTVVISDYESIYAEAKYLRDHNNKTVKNEDIALDDLSDYAITYNYEKTEEPVEENTNTIAENIVEE